MRRALLVCTLALGLCALACCAGPGARTEGSAPVPDSGTDLFLPGEPGYEDDSATDAPEDTDGEGWTLLTAEECVEDLPPYTGMVPRITLDCPGADEINRQIEETFVPMADDPECEGVCYQCAKGAGRVLSVVMEVHGPNDTVFYTPYNLDLATGEALTGEQLLALLGVDADELRNLEQALLGAEFDRQFGAVKDDTDPDFYSGQYERTTAPENAQTQRLWLAEDGQLMFVGRIYGMAGAEYYEYPLGTGMVF